MIAIATDTVDRGEIREPKKQDVRSVLFITTVLGVVSTFFDFVFFGAFLRYPHEVLRTNWFIGSIITELVFLLSIRTRGVFWKGSMPSSWVMGLSGLAIAVTMIIPYTPFGQAVFGFVAPSAAHLGVIGAIVAVYFVSTEVVKVLYYRFFNDHRNGA
jgi:Mg2+-importing ATPase